MQIQPVTYEDFSGNIITENFYFHLTKAEILRFEMERKGGLSTLLAEIIEQEDSRLIYSLFERVVLASYGVKVGEQFIKNDELRDAFSATNAYSEFIISLIQDADKGAKFIDALIPKKDLSGIQQNQAGMSPQEAARRRSEATMQGFQKKQDKKKQPQSVDFDDDNVVNQHTPVENAVVSNVTSIDESREARREKLRAQLAELDD